MDFANYTRFIDKEFAYSLGGAQTTDILVALTILTIFAVFAKLTSYLLHEILPRFTAKTETTLDDQLMPFLDKVDKIIIFTLALLMILNQLGYQLTPILAK